MKIRFGDLQVGEQFKELPDQYGTAFVFVLRKLELRVLTDGIEINAGVGGMHTFFEDDTIVEKVEQNDGK